MNNAVFGIGGLTLSAGAIIGMIDPVSVDGWLKTGAFGVGTALLAWQLLRAYRRQDELQKQATEALQKCAQCPLALAANESLLNELTNKVKNEKHEH